MFRTLIAASAASLFALPAFACDGFEAHDPYARASSATAISGAAFMALHNHGDTDCHITGVRSDIAARTELHTHSEDDQGVMRMIHVEEGFPLPAGGELLLERGGHHVMFMGLNQPLNQGDELEITLIFADSAEKTVNVTVDLEREAHGHGDSHGH